MNISSKLWSQCHDIYYISDCSNLEHRVPFPQISKTGDLLSLDPNSAEKDTSMFQCSLTQCSVQFSCSVMSDSLQPHGLHHTRLPCLSLSPGVCSNSCPLSLWFYLSVSSSAAPLSFCHQSFPASRSFPMSWLLAMSWQPKYWNFSFSIGSSSEYSGLISFRIDWLDLLAVQGTLKSLLQHHNLKASILQPQSSWWSQWKFHGFLKLNFSGNFMRLSSPMKGKYIVYGLDKPCL